MAVIVHADGRAVDHLAYGVPETVSGAAQFEALTGAPVRVPPPMPGAPFHSATLRVSATQLVEVIGPSPLPDAPETPLTPVLARLRRPAIVFWHVAVDDFDDFAARAHELGHPLVFHSHQRYDTDAGPVEFRIGRLDSPFGPAAPDIIQWIHHVLPFLPEDPVCSISSFTISHPNPAPLQRLFDGLGIPMRVNRGTGPRVRLGLSTPKGPIELETMPDSSRR